MRLITLAYGLILGAGALGSALHHEKREGDKLHHSGVSVALFSSFERLARLVDIAYCVGTAGLSKPFSCLSRCRDFPSMTLNSTWSTGMLFGDSCGYIAVDHGVPRPDTDAVRGDEKAIIVAFRGTYSIANTIVDLGTIPQEYEPYPSPDNGGAGDGQPDEPRHKCSNCTVHMGFLTSWRNSRSVVLPILQDLRQNYPDYTIHLVGHSLGGAVAALAALELKISLGWDNVIVTTFGEPRLGNQGLASFVDSSFGLLDENTAAEARTYRRITHVDDPVPLLPLTEWGYRAHAGEFFISKSELPPAPKDVRVCVGDADMECIAGADDSVARSATSGILKILRTNAHLQDKDGGNDPLDPVSVGKSEVGRRGIIPARLKLWQLLSAHRDYFWRLGVCLPGGDPKNWGQDYYAPYRPQQFDEL